MKKETKKKEETSFKIGGARGENLTLRTPTSSKFLPCLPRPSKQNMPWSTRADP